MDDNNRVIFSTPAHILIWFPRKGDELVGKVRGHMVKYLVKFADHRSGNIRIEIVDIKPLPVEEISDEE